MTGSTGMTGITGLDVPDSSNNFADQIKQKNRMENPVLSDTTLMRMSEPELQMELKKRGLIPEAIERPGLMQQLKKFFHDEILDMTGGELTRELRRKRVVPTSTKAKSLRVQLRSHIKAPGHFPVGPAWHPSYDTPNHNDSAQSRMTARVYVKAGLWFYDQLACFLSGNHAGPNKMSLRLSFKAITNKKAIGMYWTFGSCPATPCSTYKSCGSCLADKYCGYVQAKLASKTWTKQPLNGTCVVVVLTHLAVL